MVPIVPRDASFSDSGCIFSQSGCQPGYELFQVNNPHKNLAQNASNILERMQIFFFHHFRLTKVSYYVFISILFFEERKTLIFFLLRIFWNTCEKLIWFLTEEKQIEKKFTQNIPVFSIRYLKYSASAHQNYTLERIVQII